MQQKGVAVAQFFISYRRADSRGSAGRLSDSLVQRFGHDVAFRDVEDLPPGADFAGELDRALSECSAMLVVIGRTWATASNENGPRLFQEGDFVRREVAAALLRRDVVVIPVLVDGARLPSADELPEDVRALTGRQAIEITDDRWNYDVQRLGDSLVAQLGLPELEASQHRRRYRIRLAIIGVAASVAVAAAVVVAIQQSDGTSEQGIPSDAVDTIESGRDEPGPDSTTVETVADSTVGVGGSDEPSPEDRGSETVRVEAEDGRIIAPMTLTADNDASRGAFVMSPLPEEGAVRVRFEVVQGGRYEVWGRVLSPDIAKNHDSFFVALDDGSRDTWDFFEDDPDPPVGVWRWDRISLRAGGDFENHGSNPWSPELTPGSHEIIFSTREELERARCGDRHERPRVLALRTRRRVII